jgi:hypothetical protein
MAKAKGAKRAQRSKAASRKTAGARRRSAAGRSARRPAKTAKTARKTRGPKAASKSRNKKKTPSIKRAAASRPTAKGRASSARKRPARKAATGPGRRAGGTGRERELAQTPETGRTVRGRTNPMRTIRSTGTRAGAGDSRHAPGLDRERRQLREVEEGIPEPPSSLNMDRRGSAVRTGRAEMRQARREHTETSPALTGGDVDADWEDAYAVGDEAPGGDNPTPDQDIVDEIGRSLGVEYQDNEELKSADKIAERDKHRWELDPASSDDYRDRD